MLGYSASLMMRRLILPVFYGGKQIKNAGISKKALYQSILPMQIEVLMLDHILKKNYKEDQCRSNHKQEKTIFCDTVGSI